MNIQTTIILCFSIVFGGILLIPGVQALPLKSCTDDQYRRLLPNASAVCVDCPSCPDGLGPSVECGSTISAETVTQCVTCKSGVNYSTAYDHEQCEPCSVCSEDQVSKPCTPTSDTVCKKRCKSKGKYYEESSDDCQDCTWCCGDDKDIKIDECLKKGMPAQKSCTVHRRKFCKAPPSTTERASTTLLKTLLAVTTKEIQPTEKIKTTEDKNYRQSQEPTSRMSLNKRHNEYSNINNSSGDNSPPTDVVSALIGVCSALGSVLIVVGLIWLLKKYGVCTSFPREKLRIFYTKVPAGDIDSIITTYKDHRVFDLFKVNHELKEDIYNKLDSGKSFAKLARRCNISEDHVRKLEDNPGKEPTCEIFRAIEGIKPGFCFGEFANVLKEIKRMDVLEHFVKKFLASKKESQV